METIKLNFHVGTDGILQIQMPTNFIDTAVEVVLVVQPLLSEETKSKYHTWGNLTTKESIQKAIEQMQKMQQEVALPSTCIQKMIDERRRFSWSWY